MHIHSTPVPALAATLREELLRDYDVAEHPLVERAIVWLRERASIEMLPTEVVATVDVPKPKLTASPSEKPNPCREIVLPLGPIQTLRGVEFGGEKDGRQEWTGIICQARGRVVWPDMPWPVKGSVRIRYAIGFLHSPLLIEQAIRDLVELWKASPATVDLLMVNSMCPNMAQRLALYEGPI